jgi:hypothetical protein
MDNMKIILNLQKNVALMYFEQHCLKFYYFRYFDTLMWRQKLPQCIQCEDKD